MADIVERLAGPFIAEPAAQRVMYQAIEEIEHLREWNAEIALNAREFAAENERLRAALGDILSYVPHGDLPLNLYDKARAALEGRT